MQKIASTGKKVIKQVFGLLLHLPCTVTFYRATQLSEEEFCLWSSTKPVAGIPLSAWAL